MRWSRALAAAGFLRLLGVLCVLCVLHAQPQPEPKRLGIYTPQTGYTLPVIDRDGAEYVALAGVLQPLGKTEVRTDGKKFKLRFEGREAQFTPGKTRAKVHKRDLELAAPFLLDDGQGLLPIRSLPSVLAELLPKRQLSFHAGARRLFIDRPELHYAAELRKNAAGHLVVTFSAPVSPMIATEPGHLRMVFTRDPLVPNAGADTQTFNDAIIPSVKYVAQNGAAELVVNGSVPLIASFSADRKTITVNPVAPPQVAQAPPPPSPTPAPPPVPAQPPAPPPPKYAIVIDAGHGGDDRGGALSDKLAEKDVTLAFARRLYHELEARGLPARLMRDADFSLTPEQRASVANGAGPVLYLAVHATASGSGVRLFTSSLSPAGSRTAVFLPWDSAQAYFVTASQTVASTLGTELLKRDIPALTLPAAVRPLNSIAGPAVAVEIAAPPNGSPNDLNSPQYQAAVCAALANGIAASHLRVAPQGAAR